MNDQGQLLHRLNQVLETYLEKLNRRQLLKDILTAEGNRDISELIKLIASFIQLFKSAGYKSSDFKKLDEDADHESNTFVKIRSKLFFRLIKPVFDHYQKYLNKHHQIDFNDMINHASQLIKDNQVILKL